MRVTVTPLRRAGMRLKASELGPPLVGMLRLLPARGGEPKPFARMAELWSDERSSETPVGLPLFDPELVAVAPEGFSLAGVELCAQDGRVIEYRQVWRVVPISEPVR